MFLSSFDLIFNIVSYFLGLVTHPEVERLKMIPRRRTPGEPVTVGRTPREPGTAVQEATMQHKLARETTREIPGTGLLNKELGKSKLFCKIFFFESLHLIKLWIFLAFKKHISAFLGLGKASKINKKKL